MGARNETSYRSSTDVVSSVYPMPMSSRHSQAACRLTLRQISTCLSTATSSDSSIWKSSPSYLPGGKTASKAPQGVSLPRLGEGMKREWSVRRTTLEALYIRRLVRELELPRPTASNIHTDHGSASDSAPSPANPSYSRI